MSEKTEVSIEGMALEPMISEGLDFFMVKRDNIRSRVIPISK